MENNKQSRRWMVTINNPTQTDDEFAKYVQGLEHFKYLCFNRECGNIEHTTHIQAFVIFKISKRFETIKNYFPTAHLDKVSGTNTEAREYCTKSDTRIAGPYEYGEFAEERSRTDIENFLQLVMAGADDKTLMKHYPKLFLIYFNKLPQLRAIKDIDYSIQRRDVEVTYVYGPSGSGKTTYVSDIFLGKKIFKVDSFDNSAFSYYGGEEVLVIDEFKGQFSIQTINKLLDRFPVKLRGLGSLVQACFTKVYIISNFAYTELYTKEQTENIEQFKGFDRRLHTIIYIDKDHIPFIERETVWEDIPKDEQRPYAEHRRIKQVIEHNKNGTSRIIYDRNITLNEQLSIYNGDLPF